MINLDCISQLSNINNFFKNTLLFGSETDAKISAHDSA